MAVLHYYTRRGCHLCELMLEELLTIIAGRVTIEVRDIDSESQWRKKYDLRVPVIEHDGAVISDYPLDREAVFCCLAEMPENTVEIGILRR
jgi:hypothetical protein